MQQHGSRRHHARRDRTRPNATPNTLHHNQAVDIEFQSRIRVQKISLVHDQTQRQEHIQHGNDHDLPEARRPAYDGSPTDSADTERAADPDLQIQLVYLRTDLSLLARPVASIPASIWRISTR